jgi:general secretion pathway protein L
MTMRFDTIILPAAGPGAPVHWLRVVDGKIVRRGTGTGWRQSDWEDEDGVGQALLVLPPTQTTLHWIACPDMSLRQGAAAARIMALEESIGAAGPLHAVVLESAAAEQPHLVVVASEALMTQWVDWCAEHGVSTARFVPAALLLPAPDTGFVRAAIGPGSVVRGTDSAFDGDEPAAALIVAGEPVADLPRESVDALLLAALDDPPLDLRTGAFAPARPRAFDSARLTRLAVLAGSILLAMLLVSLVRIVRLNMEAARLDAQTVALARTVDPAIADPADAEVKLAARLAARGGNGGFTGSLAGLMAAMQGVPTVSLASVNQGADGTLRVRLAAPGTDAINAVLLALQDAGWRVAANGVQQQGGAQVADITVVR